MVETINLFKLNVTINDVNLCCVLSVNNYIFVFICIIQSNFLNNILIEIHSLYNYLFR